MRKKGLALLMVSVLFASVFMMGLASIAAAEDLKVANPEDGTVVGGSPADKDNMVPPDQLKDLGKDENKPEDPPPPPIVADCACLAGCDDGMCADLCGGNGECGCEFEDHNPCPCPCQDDGGDSCDDGGNDNPGDDGGSSNPGPRRTLPYTGGNSLLFVSLGIVAILLGGTLFAKKLVWSKGS